MVRVTVTRTGGLAGLRREWCAEPGPDDAPRWRALVDECPWEEAAEPAPPHGADRYAWRVRALLDTGDGRCERDARLNDPDVTGPWRALIDEVRTASASSA